MKKLKPFLIGFFSLTFIISGYMLISQLYKQQAEIDDFNDLAALVAVSPETPTDSVTEPEGTAPSTPTDTPPAAAHRNLNPLFEENPDCIGWIYIADTAVNYPVMHTPEDPERYLHKNFYQKESAAGVPFLESRCTTGSTNLILYGHNMKNGTMFADVTRYRSKDYGTAHPVIEFETGQGLKSYTVFAVARIKSDDSWYSFHSAAGKAEFLDNISDIQEKALYTIGKTPQYGQQLITLSTCYGSDKNDRIVVIGFVNND